MKKPKILIIVTLITTMFVTFISLSRYESTIEGKSEGRIATYILGISTNNIINIPISPVIPNNSQEFYFELTNKDVNENKNEVTLQYTIQLENMANLPLDFSLYKFNEATIAEYDKIELNANITDNIMYNVTEDTNHKYKLEIKWKENTQNTTYDSYKYSKTIDYIKVIVNAVQVD